ncbi:MAG TPA: TIGR02301 family protein [Caulobacter sp.]|nr:TIGR02301 family protein [Caulobacter sp.]
MHRRVFAIAMFSAFALPVGAQERPPPERQTLLDLAYALGESHALRQACEGESDQFWRDRMVRLTDTEAADAAFDGRLKQQFNSGFATRQTEFPSCSPASKRAEQAVARKGQALAGRLSSITRVVRDLGSDAPVEESEAAGPDSVAAPPAPR